VEAQGINPAGRISSIASLIGSCAILAAALLPFAAGVGWYGYASAGSLGLAAAAIAAGVCWLSGSLALVAAFVGQRLNAGIQGVLVGMIFRMGLPLGAGMALERNSPPLAAAGVFHMILALYLVALLVETLLSLRFVPRSAVKAKSVAAVDLPGGASSG
jgi:hypothetical protein